MIPTFQVQLFEKNIIIDLISGIKLCHLISFN